MSPLLVLALQAAAPSPAQDLDSVRTRAACERVNEQASAAHRLTDTYIAWDRGHCRLASMLETVPSAHAKPKKPH